MRTCFSDSKTFNIWGLEYQSFDQKKWHCFLSDKIHLSIKPHIIWQMYYLTYFTPKVCHFLSFGSDKGSIDLAILSRIAHLENKFRLRGKLIYVCCSTSLLLPRKRLRHILWIIWFIYEYQKRCKWYTRYGHTNPIFEDPIHACQTCIYGLGKYFLFLLYINKV